VRKTEGDKKPKVIGGAHIKITISIIRKTIFGEIPLYADLLVTHSKYLTSHTIHQNQNKVFWELLRHVLIINEIPYLKKLCWTLGPVSTDFLP